MTLNNVTIMELNKRIGKNFDGKLKLALENNTTKMEEIIEPIIEENIVEEITEEVSEEIK